MTTLISLRLPIYIYIYIYNWTCVVTRTRRHDQPQQAWTKNWSNITHSYRRDAHNGQLWDIFFNASSVDHASLYRCRNRQCIYGAVYKLSGWAIEWILIIYVNIKHNNYCLFSELSKIYHRKVTMKLALQFMPMSNFTYCKPIYS